MTVTVPRRVATEAEEVVRRVPCFGGAVEMRLSDEEPRGIAPAQLLSTAAVLLRAAHGTLTRFDPGSELSQLNRDPRGTVPAGPLLRRFIAAACWAAAESEGLVDASLLSQLEAAGYDRDFGDLVPPVAGERPLTATPADCEPSDRRARPDEGPTDRRSRAGDEPPQPTPWQDVVIDSDGGTVTRPPGMRLDPGGLAKGMMADRIAEMFADHADFAVDVAGDIRVGGRARRSRQIAVADPFGDEPIGRLSLEGMAVATSGTTARRWSRGGIDAHHLLDPSTGRPADTGLVQVTAVAPTALRAEVCAKAALLSGPDGADRWLRWGGVVVSRDGAVRHIPPRRAGR